ncbi:MAG: hypothetical protein J3Q66DRAFT_434942 [Benniella sp.]|nr:MAG: hypothetical protein J3Q66DRAFT_434942 [Benniella sp.]
MENPSHTVVRQKEVFDEEAAFSFRKKRPTRGPLSPPPRSLLSRSPSSPKSLSSRAPLSRSPLSRSPSLSQAAMLFSSNRRPAVPSQKRSPTPSLTYTQPFTVKSIVALKRPLLTSSSGVPSIPSVSFRELPVTNAKSRILGQKQHEKEDRQEWDLVWKGSWIVPVLETFKPASSTSSSSSSQASSMPSSSLSSRKGPTSLKKASLDNRQQTVFHGRNGVKLQPRVSELSGMAFVISKYNPSGSTSTSAPVPTPSCTEMNQMLRENTEMHLIAKIRLDTFPMFLLMSGCKEPCRIFTSPDSKTSSQFLSELFRHDDIDEMRSRCRAGDGTAVGQTGLLLRVATKSGASTKKKGTFTSSLRQDDNPFLSSNTSDGPSTLSTDTTETNEDPRRKLYQDTSMFLVYGLLTDDGRSGRMGSRRDLPTVSFYAHPLTDQVGFSEQMLLNTRTMGNLQRNMDEDKSSVDPGLSDDDDKDYIQYEDPTVDTIMNGYDDDEEEASGYESDWTHPLDNEVDDESLRQEIELLNAIERSKIWSPFPLSNTSRNLQSRNML